MTEPDGRDGPPGGPRGGRPQEGTPEYDWLYGSGGQAPRTPPSEGAGDPDRTRILPATPPPGPPPSGSRARRQERSRSTAPVPPNVTPPRLPPAPPPGYVGPQGRPPGRRRRFRPGTVVKALLVLVLLWLVFLIAVPIYAVNRVSRIDATPSGERPSEQDGTTYLVVGSDKADDLSEEQQEELDTGPRSGNRTDTILLVHSGSGPTVVMSLPRDTLVEVPGHGETMINAAFTLGQAPLLVQTVENLTGIRVDHYVEVGFGSVINTVDALGGVEVCPDAAIDDPKARLKIAKGCQEVDGMTALGYSRTRASARADLDRVGRQREVISAIGDRLVSPWTVLNPVRYWRFNIAAADAVRIDDDMGVLDLARFARAMTGSTKQCTMPVLPAPSDPNRLVVDQDRAPALFEHVIEDDSAGIPADSCTATGLPRSLS